VTGCLVSKSRRLVAGMGWDTRTNKAVAPVDGLYLAGSLLSAPRRMPEYCFKKISDHSPSAHLPSLGNQIPVVRIAWIKAIANACEPVLRLRALRMPGV
jgi:hypothetical protein